MAFTMDLDELRGPDWMEDKDFLSGMNAGYTKWVAEHQNRPPSFGVAQAEIARPAQIAPEATHPLEIHPKASVAVLHFATT